MRFTVKEKRDLFAAGVLLSLAFAILIGGGLEGILRFDYYFSILFIAAFVTAGFGFLFHELMHKYAAERYGLQTEFRAFYPMLLFSILFSFFGFIFAAPGAVFINGKITRSENGKVSFAGPMTNLVLAIVFLIPILIIFGLNVQVNNLTRFILDYGMSINALLALFNLIPIMPFDGAKVFAWNKAVYIIAVLAALLLFILSYGI